MAPELDRQVAESLPRTWGPFFSRFGLLTAPQRAAILPILNGRDVLVIAATASGKTEAACAPLLESKIVGQQSMLLYVSPTRALVNDLYERLSWPCEELGLSLSRRTGDHGSLPAIPPQILITTPESFDSLLCRAHREDGHLFSNVCAVVLDEVHLLHGTPRGEQVRWLLWRLRRLRDYAKTQGWTKSEGVQVCALSATVDDPDRVSACYLVNGQTIVVPGGREIEEVEPNGATPGTEDSLIEYVRNLKRDEKILVFSNSRKRVDQLCHDMHSDLVGLGFSVHAHHGSLSKEARERAEQEAKERSRIVLFATSTLEIGIDIGDIDLVVLDGPPHDVRSLLQRIGRGNRRTSITRVMPCAGSVVEMILQAAMLNDAREGHLSLAETGPQLAVARQQVVSYIFQRLEGVRSREALTNLIDGMCIGQDATRLIDHLALNGELQHTARGYRLSQELLDSATAGEIHSNIESSPGQLVVDDYTGVEFARGVKFKGGPAMRIGGQLLAVKDASSAVVAVSVANDRGLQEAKWNYVSGAWMHSASQPDSLRRFLEIEPLVWPIVHVETGLSAVFHFGGDRRRTILKMLEANLPDVAKIDPWAIYFRQGSPSKPPQLASCLVADLEVQLPKQFQKLERDLVRPQANRGLPPEWRIHEVKEWLSLDKECSIIRDADWVDFSNTRTAKVLQLFVSNP